MQNIMYFFLQNYKSFPKFFSMWAKLFVPGEHFYPYEVGLWSNFDIQICKLLHTKE
jgi:hypothetical protein